MSETSYLSVVIPAYNEARVIEDTLDDVFGFLASRSFEAEVLVVNDASTDDTLQRVKDFSTSEWPLKTINLTVNRGKGYAVKSGMLRSSGSVRLFMDADNATGIEEFQKMKPHFDDGADVVIGSRRQPDASIEINQPLWREYGGQLFNHCLRWLLDLEYRDTQVGFKAFRGPAADAIFDRQRIHGWAFDVELLVIADQLGYEVRQVPITWADRGKTEVDFGGIVSACLDLLTIRQNRHAEVYN